MKELREFLENHPHLIPMQMEIDRNLKKLDSPEARCYYISVEMFSKMDELLDAMKELNEKASL